MIRLTRREKLLAIALAILTGSWGAICACGKACSGENKDTTSSYK